MSHLECPLCGRWTALSQLTDDPIKGIYTVSLSGLGRGKGFTVSERQPVSTESSLADLLGRRASGILTIVGGELANAKTKTLEMHLIRLRKQVNELEAQLAASEDENDETEAMEAEMEQLLHTINAAEMVEYEDLEEGVLYLLREVEEMRAALAEMETV